MNSKLIWSIRKDVRASRFSLLLYLLMLVGVELALAHHLVERLGFPLQAAVTVFGLWILWLRCREDSPNRWDTRWIATRPISLKVLFTAKCTFFLLLILLPFMLTRLLISLVLGFGFLNGIHLGLNATLLPLWPGLLVLNVQGYRLYNSLFFSAVLFSITLGFFVGIRSNFDMDSAEFAFQGLREHDPEPKAAELIDPWIRIEMPQDRLLMEASTRIPLHYANEVYRMESTLQKMGNHARESRWYWHFQRRYPERHVVSPFTRFSMNASTQRQTESIRDGKRHWRFVYTELPEELTGSVKDLQVELNHRLLRVQPVWSGVLREGVQRDGAVRGTFTALGGNQIELVLQGPVTSGVSGSRAFWNWFESKLGAVTLQVSPDSDLLVLPARIRQTDTGFPAFTRRYILEMEDPRQFFPEESTLSLTVYGAAPEASARTHGTMPLWMRSERSEMLRQLAQENPVLLPSSISPHQKPEADPMASDRFAAQVDRILDWSDIQTLSDPRIPKSTRTLERLERLRSSFRPEAPRDLQDLLDRMAWHPYLLAFLPEEKQTQGVERIRQLLRNPPITNPMGLLSQVERIGIDLNEEELAGVAWCLLHPSRIVYQLEWRGAGILADRPPLNYFDMLPTDLRQTTWDSAWHQIRMDLDMAKTIRLRPEYLLEALQRQSLMAEETTNTFLKRTSIDTFDLLQDRQDYRKLRDLRQLPSN